MDLKKCCSNDFEWMQYLELTQVTPPTRQKAEGVEILQYQKLQNLIPCRIPKAFGRHSLGIPCQAAKMLEDSVILKLRTCSLSELGSLESCSGSGPALTFGPLLLGAVPPHLGRTEWVGGQGRFRPFCRGGGESGGMPTVSWMQNRRKYDPALLIC